MNKKNYLNNYQRMPFDSIDEEYARIGTEECRLEKLYLFFKNINKGVFDD